MLRVIIVEDEPLVGLSLEDEVRQSGHELAGNVTSAEKARELMREAQPDVWLIDLHLDDGETGCALAREVRAEFNVPAILVTGWPEKARECREALGVIAKPLAKNAVAEALAAVEVIKAGGKPVHAADGLELFESAD